MNLLYTYKHVRAFRVIRRKYTGSITHTMNANKKKNEKKEISVPMLPFIRVFFFVFVRFFFGRENARYFFRWKFGFQLFKHVCDVINNDKQINSKPNVLNGLCVFFSLYFPLFNSINERCHHRPKISSCKQKWSYSFYMCIREISSVWSFAATETPFSQLGSQIRTLFSLLLINSISISRAQNRTDRSEDHTWNNRDSSIIFDKISSKKSTQMPYFSDDFKSIKWFIHLGNSGKWLKFNDNCLIVWKGLNILCNDTMSTFRANFLNVFNRFETQSWLYDLKYSQCK